jgi:HSP20 family protein
MSLLNIIRRAPTEKAAIAPAGNWEPFRVMRDLLHLDPFRELTTLVAPPEWVSGFAPDFEVKETKDSYVFRADLPGVQEKDVEIALLGNRLTVSGKRESEVEEKGETFFICERSYGAFTRAFTLPEGVDPTHVTAALNVGVLTIVLPKLPEAQPRKIEIKGAEIKS